MELIEVETKVVNFINNLVSTKEFSPCVGKFLWINNIQEAQLWANCGLDITNPEFLKVCEKVHGKNSAFGGQCFAGPIGKKIVDSYESMLPEPFRPWISHEVISRYLSTVAGYVVIYTTNIARGIWQAIQAGMPLSDEGIEKIVLMNIGHEWRHANQSESLVEFKTNNIKDREFYDSQCHEKDANIFGIALAKGWVTFADAATWQPTQEQKEKALKIYNRIMGRTEA